MTTAVRDGALIAGSHVALSGERGPWVVLSHATAQDRHSFDQQVAILAACGWRVLSWDLPGHGCSPPWGRPVTMPALAEHLHGLCCDAIGPGYRAVLVGHSLGGYLSQHLALTHADHVRGLVAVGCTSVTLLPRWWQMALLRGSATLLAVAPRTLQECLLAHTRCASAETRRYLRYAAAQADTQAVVHAWHALTCGLSHQPDVRLVCPVLVAHGQHDDVGIIPTAARSWAVRHGASYHVIPHAAHHAHLDNPVDFNETLLAFLEHVAPPAPH